MNVNPLLALLGGVGDGIQAVDKRHAEEDQQRRLDEQQRASQAMVALTFDKNLHDAGFVDANDPRASTADAGLVNSPIPGQVNGPAMPLDLRSKRQFTDPSGAARNVVYVPGETAEARALKQMTTMEDYRAAATARNEAAKQAGDAANKTKATLAQQQRDYNTLKTEFPTDALAKPAFDETNPADYTAALANARELHRLNAASPKDHWVVAGVDKTTGDPLILNTVTGETRQGGGIKQQTAGVGNDKMSAQMVTTMQRLGMSRADLDGAIKEMDQYENDPKNLERINAWQQTMAAAAQTIPDQHPHGALGGLNNAAGAGIAAAAQRHLADSDPAFAKYLLNRSRVATAFTEILPRPNQELLGIEKGLSGIDAGWTPGIIQDLQSRRRSGLSMIDQALNAVPLGRSMRDGGSGAAAGTGSTSGNIDLRSAPALSAEDRAHAARDPGFADWLRSKGYQVP